MWYQAVWMGHPIRLELTREGLLILIANHYTTRDALQHHSSNFQAFYLDVAPGYMNGTPNKT